ncbi:MAG: 3,4-dihydroxy 2-butanone 4-phosphate synthase / cyclohydrolase [Solirubrobacteraceae bacterium]|jgi:3,4-dihydroxy-2-butanone 4-phosphate synthase|nr:3,4-dihydroxy 2-butanone 4-phosphate synthase / cyclohydrolase [Solirubrobacteraceae bacterium]
MHHLNLSDRLPSRRARSCSNALREVLSAFATGVIVVTSHGEAGDYGVAVNSFTSVSLDPPLVLVCLGVDSPGRAAIVANGAFAVNVLSAGQEALARRFARRDRPRGNETFAGVDYRRGLNGSAILSGVAAHLECRLAGFHHAGDHGILLGEVLQIDGGPGRSPLLFHGGRYRELGCVAPPDPAEPSCSSDAMGHGGAFASAAEAIDEIRAGRMVVVWDGENRQNEGDLVLAAEKVTSGAVNFMAREGRGLISLALSHERCERLALAPMSARNESAFGTAFTVSVEARVGVATGISALDRAQTIRVACHPASNAGDLVRPGHVFPLRACAGGTLERPGHTEAAVELARLAGLAPAGALCQIMNDDGTMARVPDLVRFCARHKLKMVSVGELIAHRLQAQNVRELAPAA